MTELLYVSKERKTKNQRLPKGWGTLFILWETVRDILFGCFVQFIQVRLCDRCLYNLFTKNNATRKRVIILYISYLQAQNWSNLLNFFCHTLVLHIKMCTPMYSSHLSYHSFYYHNPHCIRGYSPFHKSHQNNLPYRMLKTL